MDYEIILETIRASVVDNIMFYAIAIAAILGKIKESSKQNIFFVWISYFVGTFFHELSHFIASLLLNGKPKKVSLFPSSEIDQQTNKRTITLGYVESANVQWYNAFFISMSPLLLLPLSFFVYQNFFVYFEETLLNIFIYIYLIVSLLFSSIPSGADFQTLYKNRSFIATLFPPILIIISIFLFSSHKEDLIKIFQ